jgi:hypothetical protein
VLPRILRFLPGLTHLVLDFDGQNWVSQPDLLKTSLHATFSRHCLRGLCLTDLRFDNVSELEALLSSGLGLKELILDGIGFDSSVQRINGPREPRVVIESLTLLHAEDALVSSFSAVDIKHLHSLVLVSTPLLPLLKANAQTLQKVRITLSDGPLNSPKPLYSHC